MLNRVCGHIHYQQHHVRPGNNVRKPGLHILSRHWRSVNQLNLDVFKGHHAGSRNPGGVRKIRHFRSGISECSHQCGFAHVGRTDKYDLSRTFGVNPVTHISSAGCLFCLLLGLELGEPTSEIGP